MFNPLGCGASLVGKEAEQDGCGEATYVARGADDRHGLAARMWREDLCGEGADLSADDGSHSSPRKA